jgi:hypothetical protein
MPKPRAASPLPLLLPLPSAAGEKACFRASENKHALEFRGTPCHCSVWLRWFSVINPCNVYFVDRNRAGAPIVCVYTVIRPRRKKHAFSGRRAGNYTKAGPCL